jgi:hypothetical protein
VTNRIFIGDVGQDTFEEIDVIEPGDPAGLNFQWNGAEGDHGDLKPNIGFDKRPIIDYTHGSGDGLSVIGGYVYRGPDFPELFGKYIFGDNVTGRIWYLDESPHTTRTRPEKMPIATMAEGPDPKAAAGYAGLSSFGFDQRGELLLCRLGSEHGAIHKLSRTGVTPQQMPPTLSATHVFSDLTKLTPADGFVSYEVNTPLWSDGALKSRWMGVPTGDKICYQATGEWSFPDGTVFVKHFDLPIDETDATQTRRLETRLLVRDDNAYVYGGT